MVFTVGLTGGISSGKTTAANYFAEQNIDIIDADIIARKVVEPGTMALEAIQTYFGDSILTREGSLNRKQLRSIIFNDLKQKRWLECLLHPIIRKQVIMQLKYTRSPYAIFVSPLLLETNQYLLVDRVLVIDTSEKQQIARTVVRDQCSEAEAKAILGTQLSRDKRVSKANDVINNNSSLTVLYEQLECLHRTYLKTAQNC